MSHEYNLFDLLQPAPSESTAKTHTQTPLKRVVEALLFAANEPITFQKLRDIIAEFQPVTPQTLRLALKELNEDYQKHGNAFLLEEIAQGYVLRTRATFSQYLDALFRERRSERLSPAATEVLAIIAYRQPITRSQVESIRGVDCTGVIQTLLERQLITQVGKLEAPGRPTLLGTTKEFLCHYGLRDTRELPTITLFE